MQNATDARFDTRASGDDALLYVTKNTTVCQLPK